MCRNDEFLNKITTKKGTLAEQFVKERLDKMGWGVCSHDFNKSHEFDLVLFNNKREIVYGDVKCKPEMKLYNGTGIDKHFHDKYMFWKEKYNTKFYIFFVDDERGEIFWGEMDELCEEVIDVDEQRKYPIELKQNYGNGRYIIYHKSKIKHFEYLTDKEYKSLQKYNTMALKYKQIQKNKRATI